MMCHDESPYRVNSVTLQSDFYRVLKTKIRTKNETRKTQKQVGFLDLVVFVGPSVEPQPPPQKRAADAVVAEGSVFVRGGVVER